LPEQNSSRPVTVDSPDLARTLPRTLREPETRPRKLT
jgi:hypothetical protein